MKALPRLNLAPNRQSDVCLLVEGCYPHVSGGVSSWVDWLIRSQPDLSFAVVSIVSGREHRVNKYAFPSNLVSFEEVELQPLRYRGRLGRQRGAEEFGALADALVAFVKRGELATLQKLAHLLNSEARAFSHRELVDSPLTWRLVTGTYMRLMPHASFLAFHWAWRALFGGLFAILTCPVPRARVYHSTCTGYAGLLAARAALESGRRLILTEHGIYTNERRIEILMADWIADQVDKGFDLDDPRLDLRDLWVTAFESYARACYEAASAVTTLYGENQVLQVNSGADPGKLRIIPNGIDLERFAAVPAASDEAPPTMAYVGRVVPIKDVKSFIAAVAKVREAVPGVRGLVLGPLDEDPAYAADCQQFAGEVGLSDVVSFPGRVDVVEWFARVHVLVLSSLSEAQPLTLLEAGAAGIPCVATDVGSCREIIEGRPDEWPQIGAGGFVCELVSPESLARQVVRLLRDAPLRRAMGERLRRRTRTLYTSARASAAYRDLYQDNFSEQV